MVTKLCTDCEHFCTSGIQSYLSGPMGAMCIHPEAPRSLIDGSPKTLCSVARGEPGVESLAICGREGKLFEQHAPESYKHPEWPPLSPASTRPGGIVQIHEDSEVWNQMIDPKKSWWQRIFGD